MTDIVKITKKFLETNSQNRNKNALKKTIEFLIDYTSDLPIIWGKIDNDETAPILVGRSERNDTNSKIILSGHFDTVYSSDEAFPVREDNEKIYASGAQDMKSSIICMFEALKFLNKKRGLRDLVIILSPDEEVGVTDVARETIMSIAPEGDHILVFESTLDNNPEADLNKRSVVLSRNGLYHFTINIKGPGGHSGVINKKSERISTNIVAAEIILELEKLANYDLGTTLNTGIINGGSARNVLSDISHLKCEIRIKESKELDRSKTDVRKLVDAYREKYPTVEIVLIEEGYNPPLISSSQDRDYAEKLKQLAKNIGLELEVEHRTGASEANFFEEANPDAIIIDGLGVRGDHQHSKSEYVYKKSLGSTRDFLIEILEDIQN